MNIFFTASVYGRPHFDPNYAKILTKIKEAGHMVNEENVLSFTNDEIKSWSPEKNIAHHKKLMESVKQADAFFAEVSNNSTSIGYLMSLAMQSGKPVVAFYSGQEEPHLFQTLEETSDKFQIIRYNSVKDLDKEVDYAIDFAVSAQDTRFNFFISPELSSYLDYIAKTRKIPRSVYLRNLIDRDIERHPEFDRV